MEYDVYELLIELMGSMDTQFQFWLTITSAFIAAHYIAGHKLGPLVRTYLSIVYLCSCVLIFYRMLLVSEIILELLDANTQTAFTGDSAGMAGVFRLIVITVGTLGALVYSIFYRRISGVQSEESSSITAKKKATESGK